MQPECYLTKEPLNAVSCNGCGFIFLSPRPDPKKGQDYFNKAYSGHEDFSDHEYYRDHDKKLYQSRLKIEAIEKLKPTGKKLLDVGAGQGHFMKEAIERGWDVVGTELSVEARESAKKLFKIDLKESFSDYGPETFDVITLWDVLEHVS
jgi:2-polyprenyl-3-methyl-5-hydroxy-6-metoxy-1,4-benzoquinol methylase